MTEWNHDLEKRILKKSKFTLTLKILKNLFIVLLLYFTYIYSLYFLQDKLKVASKNHYYSSLVLEWTVPNVRGDYTFTEEDTNIFGTKTFSYNLFKRVGNDYNIIGEAKVTKKLFNSGSTILLSTPTLKELSGFTFSLPENPKINKKIEIEESDQVWKTLEKLPEGTVGEVAFSTTSFMEPENLIKKLHGYDLKVLWMPLYTGEFKDYEPNFWGQTNNELYVHDVIGLTGGTSHNKDFTVSTRILELDEENIEESKQLMLKNMEELLDKSESYRDFLGINNLEKKYKYLKDEGFIVYGAVVTGPVKELLKLKDEPFIQGEQLGEVELWNWEN